MKKSTLIFGALAAALCGQAAPLSPEAALGRAVGNGAAKAFGLNQSRFELVSTQKTQTGDPSVYIFAKPNESGFALVSADDTMIPLLGYGDGRFDADNIPPQLQWLISEYGRMMEQNIRAGVSAADNVYVVPGAEAVGPLLKTIWNQDQPYNNQCPILSPSTTPCPTGCVATSFAQVMNYFKYPEIGQGSVTYKTDAKRYTMNFAREAFDWDNMLDEYTTGKYNDAQANAVSYLMKACGYGVEMNYGIYQSGAQSYKLMNAAVNYFKYDAGISYRDRNYYSYPEWAKLVYDNVKNVGPVIYDGYSIDGGHSFVCDGYDGNGYFHFNWGWGGMSDGYYILDSLNPEGQGIGGAEGGFNYNQSALFNMQPPAENSPVTYDNIKIYGTATASLVGDNILFGATDYPYGAGWSNGVFRDLSVNVGGIIQNLDNPSATPVYSQGGMSKDGQNLIETITLSPTSYYPTSTINPTVPIPAGLADGRYTVTLAARQTTVENAPWTPFLVVNGMANYCFLTVENGKYTVETAAAKRLKVESCVITSPLYLGRNAQVVTTFSNPTDETLTLSYSPVLARSGATQYQGDMMLVTVAPGQTYEKTSLVAFYQMNGATNPGTGEGYQLLLLDRITGKTIGTYGDYTMDATGSGFTLALNDFAVEDAEQETLVRGSRTFKNVYLVPNSADFDIIVNYTVKAGYFDTSIRMVLSEFDEELGKFVVDQANLYYDTPFLGTGETANVILPLDFRNRSQHNVYQVRLAYMKGGQTQSLGSLYFAFNRDSSVEGIEADNDAKAEYYTLQGVKVETPATGQTYIQVTNGKAEKILMK